MAVTCSIRVNPWSKVTLIFLAELTATEYWKFFISRRQKIVGRLASDYTGVKESICHKVLSTSKKCLSVIPG